MPSWLIQGIIPSLIAGAIGFCASKILDWVYHFRGSPYSGVWEDQITNSEGVVEKCDSYKIRHNRRTNELSGTIYRIYPNNQSYRKWKMTGKIDGGYILFNFWSVVDTHKSRGCAFLRHKKDNVYVGYYLEDHEDGNIDKTPIRLMKKP